MASEATYQKYRRAARYPLFLAGLLFLLGFGLALDPHLKTLPDHHHVGRALTLASWGVFLADYLISLTLAPDRVQYVRTHVLQAIGVIFPPLRILLIFHVTYEVARHSRARFGHRVREYLLYLSTMVILASSAAVMVAERNAPGATIVSFGDALWWSAETISTVGYGDMYPVTVTGRVIAVALMVNGFTILSVLTATVAQKFLSSQRADASMPDAEPLPEPEA
ncbi:MAG: potassium channel family protein [Candidatus Nanopelagicales bacterium]